MTGRLGGAVTGAVTVVVTLRVLSACAPTSWMRVNYRGRPVSLAAGPALAAALATSPEAAIAAGGSALVGAYDDAAADSAKGVRGHLGALFHGRLTPGGVKVLGISAAGALAAGRLEPRGAPDVLLGGAVIAGAANLVNLLDLRPGRALKVGLLAALALREPRIAASCAALLPADLGESVMLGDTGANALGAALGVAGVRRLRSRRGRCAVLAVLAALTAVSERVSFSAVIDRTPPLRWLDAVGRQA